MKNKKGFTLIEIIICIVLIVLIGGISVVFITKEETKTEEEKNILSSADVYVSTNNMNDIVFEQNNEKFLQVSELIDKGLLDEQSYIKYKDKCVRMFKNEDLINEYEISENCINLAYLDVKIKGDIKEYYEQSDVFPIINTKAILNGNDFVKIEVYVDNHLIKTENSIDFSYQIKDGDKDIKIILYYKTETDEEKTAIWSYDKEFYKDKADLKVELINFSEDGIYCKRENLPKLEVKPELTKNNIFNSIEIKVNGIVKKTFTRIEDVQLYQIEENDKNIEILLNYKSKSDNKQIKKEIDEEFNLYNNNMFLHINDNNLTFTGINGIKKLNINGDYVETSVNDLNNNMTAGETFIKIFDSCNEKKYKVIKEKNGYDIIGLQEASKTYFYNSSKSDEYNFKFIYIFPDGAVLYEKTDVEGKRYVSLNIYNPNTEKHIEIGNAGGNSSILVEKINANTFKIYRKISYTLNKDKYLKYQISEYNSTTSSLVITNYLERYVDGFYSFIGSPCYCKNRLIFRDLLTDEKLAQYEIKELGACWDSPSECVERMDSNKYSKKNSKFWSLKKIYDEAEKKDNLVYSHKDGLIKRLYTETDSLAINYFRDSSATVSSLLKSKLKTILGRTSIQNVNYYYEDTYQNIDELIWEKDDERIIIIPYQISSKHDISLAFLRYKDKYKVTAVEID